MNVNFTQIKQYIHIFEQFGLNKFKIHLEWFVNELIHLKKLNKDLFTNQRLSVYSLQGF